MSTTGAGETGGPLSLGSTMAATIVAGLQTAADDHTGEADRLRALCRAGDPLPLVALLWPAVVLDDWQADIVTSVFDPAIREVFVKGNAGCGKGAAAALIAYGVAPDLASLAALATVLGHLFPVWLRFQGGKGVATTFGVYLALSWPVGLCAFGIWLAVVFTTRISSLSALIAALLSPVFAWYFADPRVAAVLAILAVLVIIRHKDNIVRLRRGEEPKIGLKRK